MNPENARTSAAARPDPASSLGSEAALAMAGFVAGSLSRHVKPLPLACALAAGGWVWRCLSKKRPSSQPLSIPADFTSEAEFLRYFQEELTQQQQQVVIEPASERSQTVEPMAEATLLPLQTEEDFLRLFKAEMASTSALQIETPALPLAESPAVPMQTEDDFMRQFQVDMATMPEAPKISPLIVAPVAPPSPEPMAIIAAAVEKTLAAAEQPPEQIIAQNAAWLLGLEPLPMIQFDDAPPSQSMPAEIPDCVEISDEPAVTQRPSSRGLLGQMLEQEPASSGDEVAIETPAATPTPAVQQVTKPEILVPAWLNAGLSIDSNSRPSDTSVKVREPEASFIKPRRIVPRAPVTVPVEGDSKRWLNWWK